MEVGEVVGPHGGLVFGDGGDDGDVFRSVRRIEQAQRPPRPPKRGGRGHVGRDGGDDTHRADRAHGDAEADGGVIGAGGEEGAGRARGQGGVQRGKRHKRAKVFRHQDSVEADDGDGGGLQGADDDEGSVRDVQAWRQTPRHNTGQRVNRQQVDDERVPPPRRHHVEVGQAEGSGPGEGPGFQGFDIEKENRDQRKDGDALIVKRARHRARHVGGDDRHEGGGDKAGAPAPHFTHEGKRGERGQRGEQGGGEHAHLLHVDGQVEGVQDAVHGARGPDEALVGGGGGGGGGGVVSVPRRAGQRHHKTIDSRLPLLTHRVDRAPNDASQRVPGRVIEPVPQAVEVGVGQELGDAWKSGEGGLGGSEGGIAVGREKKVAPS